MERWSIGVMGVMESNGMMEIPLNPPFSKGELAQRQKFPLFEKEGSGEICTR
jgi:hypothetical protein